MKPVVFLDMDGVVADFYKAVWNAGSDEFDLDEEHYWAVIDETGGHHRKYENLFGSRENFVKLVQMEGAPFWAYMPKLAWADKLVSIFKEWAYDNNVDLAFLSSPSSWWSYAPQGKKIWLERNYPGIPLIVTEHKYLVAGFTNLLIDDLPYNTDKFAEAGGASIIFPYSGIKAHSDNFDIWWENVKPSLDDWASVTHKFIESCG